MNQPLPADDTLLDLLGKRALEGLTPAEEARLEELLRSHPGAEADAFDDVVAQLTTAASPRERMPPQLRARILRARENESRAVSAAVAADAATASAPAARPRAAAPGVPGGWWAAAACLVLAVLGWWPRLVGTPGSRPAAPPAAAEARANLLQQGGVIRAALDPGPDASAGMLQGDVVFDPRTQTGYLRFRGIPANDPRLAQYQLWIADRSRAQPEPVDGGTFDVPSTAANGDVIIPFHAKLPVGAPAAFVVTVERPGGVVVSRQERVLALGTVGGGA